MFILIPIKLITIITRMEEKKTISFSLGFFNRMNWVKLLIAKIGMYKNPPIANTYTPLHELLAPALMNISNIAQITKSMYPIITLKTYSLAIFIYLFFSKIPSLRWYVRTGQLHQTWCLKSYNL